MNRIIGRRKTSVAILKSGRKEGILINGKFLKDYFKQERVIEVVNKVIKIAQFIEQTDAIKTNLNFEIKVLGGGLNSQAQAIQLAMARYLANISPILKNRLNIEKLLTYDDRQVERKKCGLLGARKHTPFVKR